MRGRFFSGLGQVSNFAEFSMHASGKNDGAPLTGNQRSPRQQQVFCLKGACIGNAFRTARFGLGFPGNGRRIDPDLNPGNQATIRRDVVALFEQDEIARHQTFNRQRKEQAVAHDLDVLRQQFAKRGNRLLRPVFLPERKAAIDQDNGDDGNAQLPHALRRAAGLGEEGQAGSHPQNQRKEVGEFAEKLPPLRLAPDFVNTVLAIFPKASLGLGRTQAFFRCPEAVQSIRHGKICDVHDPVLGSSCFTLRLGQKYWAVR